MDAIGVLSILVVLVGIAAAVWFLRQRPPAADSIADSRLEVNASASRSGARARVDVAVSSTDLVTGAPVDVAEVVVEAVFGIDHEESTGAERIDVGRYLASFETEFAGTADIRASATALGLDAVVQAEVPPGEIDRLTIGYGEVGAPDGETPHLVTVAAEDALGNAAGEGFSQFDVVGEVRYTFRYNQCDEAELAFRSDVAGTQPVTIHERVSGLSVEAHPRFPRLAVGSSPGLPLAGDPQGGAGFTVPVAVSIPESWEFGKAQLTLRTDAGMDRIASFVGARGADPSCFDVAGTNVTSGVQGTTVVIDLFRPIRKPGRAVALVDFSTLVTEPGGGDVEGELDVDGLDADTPHPETGDTGIQVDDSTSSGGTFLCSSKKMFKGCVIYVRTRPPEGEDPISDEAIADAHKALNETFRDACVFFDMSIATVTVVGSEVEQDLTSKGKIARAMNHVRGALADAGIDTEVDGQECLVVAIMNYDVKGKGVSLSAGPGDALESLDGTTLMESGIFGATRSLAHEIGHHLDGRDQEHSHRHDRDNLMTPTDGRHGKGTELTDAQKSRMQGSKWLESVEVPIYYQIARY